MKATISRDINGNKVVRVKPMNGRGFSIQTNGNLPECHRQAIGTSLESHFSVELWKEIRSYVKEFGTIRQNTFFA